MYLIKTPSFIQGFFSDILWRGEGEQKQIYLSFDDGPQRKLTNWLIDCLARYEARASFFLVGENILRYPDAMQALREAGHGLGNHGLRHLNGWKSSVQDYVADAEACRMLLPKETAHFFRPPYGRLGLRQKAALLKLGYRIVLWDILSADFDLHYPKEKALQKTLKLVEPGSIVVFHDNERFASRLQYLLPAFLDILSERGFRFVSLF